MLLYDNATSGNCYKVRLLLAHLGIAYERHELDVVDRSDRPQIIGDLNPALRIPTLVFDDGRPLAESDAILFHLAEGTRFLPADAYERALVLQWLFFEQYQHEPNIAVVRFWVQHEEAGATEEQTEARRQVGYATLDSMERHLAQRRYLVGDALTIADLSLYAYTHVAHEGGFEMGRYPSIGAWLGRVAGEPGHITIDV